MINIGKSFDNYPKFNYAKLHQQIRLLYASPTSSKIRSMALQVPLDQNEKLRN